MIGIINTHCECYTNENGPYEGTELGFHLNTSVSSVITIPPTLLAHLFVYHQHYTRLTFESIGKLHTRKKRHLLIGSITVRQL